MVDKTIVILWFSFGKTIILVIVITIPSHYYPEPAS